ncbi:hypothetical protein Tco_1376778 [Tanacetum coccineum]
MNPLIVQQRALDDALVATDDHVIIGKCNMRIEPIKPYKEATYQVALDVLKLSPCYKVFLVTVDVPEIYMHQFWFTITKIKDCSSYRCRPAPPFKSSNPLGYVLKKNVDFVELIWEDFMYQIDNRQTTAARRLNMPYPSVLGFLKFVSKYEVRQVYGKLIPDVMVIPKEARKRTKAHMKESSLTVDDTIISKDPDAALELAKLINKTKAEERKAARLVHETHERLVTDKLVITRKQTGVVLRDTPTVSKKKPLDQSQKLKGVQVLSGKKREATDLKKVIRASKLILVPSHDAGSSEGAGLKPEVADESKVDDEENDHDADDEEEEDVDEEDVDDDDRSINIVETSDEETESENGDQVMEAAKKHDDDKAEEEKDTIHEPVQREQAKDDQEEVLAPKTHKEKPILLVSTSSHYVSYNYSNLVSSPERSLRETGKESTDAEVIPMVDVQVHQEILVVLSAPLLDIISSIFPPTPTNPTPPPVQTTTTTITKFEVPPPSTSSNPDSTTIYDLLLKVSDLENEVQELKQAYYSPALLASMKYEIPSVVDTYLGSKLGDALQQKSVADIRKIKMEHVEKQHKTQHPSKSFDKTALVEYDHKDILFQMMWENKTYLKHPTHQKLYDALTESLILDENEMDKTAFVVSPA